MIEGYGLHSLRKKSFEGGIAGWGSLRGLKPNIDLIGFIGPTEVVPLLQSLCIGHAREFFRKLFSPYIHPGQMTLGFSPRGKR
jgi:hypothetical protein